MSSPELDEPRRKRVRFAESPEVLVFHPEDATAAGVCPQPNFQAAAQQHQCVSPMTPVLCHAACRDTQKRNKCPTVFSLMPLAGQQSSKPRLFQPYPCLPSVPSTVLCSKHLPRGLHVTLQHSTRSTVLLSHYSDALTLLRLSSSSSWSRSPCLSCCRWGPP
jgi:hypothetical protein